MNEFALRAYIASRNRAAALIKDETGEGVISAAIAVLIMAALGALMWVGFKALWGDASNRTSEQVNNIGR